MDDRQCARLRAQAEHCRVLASHMNDKRSIDALKQTAREYDDDATRIETAAAAK